MSHSDNVQCHELVFDGGKMVFDSGRIQRPSPALFDPGNPELGAQAVGQGGRQAAWFVNAGSGSAVLRHYRRGGLIARISKNRYIWRSANSTRSLAEFHILQRMHAQGLPVPRPLAAAYWRSGLFYRAAILIERIPNVQTLTEVVRASREPDPAVQKHVAQAVFALHESGFWHADLNAYNILLDHNGKVWLIDFDKAIETAVSPAARERNLSRLLRSMRKVAPQTADVWWKGINQAYKAFQQGENSTLA